MDDYHIHHLDKMVL